MDRRNRLTFIISAIAVFLTFIIFFQMTKTRTEVDWYALIFILIAELGTLGGLIAVNAEAKRSFSLMLKAGTYTVLGLYTVATIVLSILFTSVSALREYLGLFKSIQASLIALAAIIILILASAARTIAKRNKAAELKKSQSGSNI